MYIKKETLYGVFRNNKKQEDNILSLLAFLLLFCYNDFTIMEKRQLWN